MKTALCQMNIHKDWRKNIHNAEKAIADAAASKADMVVLPEMFICPYNRKAIAATAQPEGGTAWKAMSEAAKINKVYLVAGCMPETDDGRIYSTSYVFDREGKQIGKYRKLHLCDIDVKGGQKCEESAVFTPGNEVTVVDTEFGKIGIAICYDVRFPEMFRMLEERGAKAVMIPASFNRVTGPAHWELLVRARAVDQQIYVIGCAAAGEVGGANAVWGHSLAVDPWGQVMEKMGERTGILMVNIDFDFMEEIRREIPVLSQRRTDIYNV